MTDTLSAVPPLDQPEAVDVLFMRVMDFAAVLRSAGVREDTLIYREELQPAPGLWARVFRRKAIVPVTENSWNLHGCPAAGIDSMVLSFAGEIWINSAFPLAGDAEEGLQVMHGGIPLNHSHFETFARVGEIEAQLKLLAAKHGVEF